MEVNPVAVIKRKTSSSDISFEKCIFCQDDRKETIRKASEEGKLRVKEVTQIRRKLRDKSNSEVLERFESIDQNVWSETKISWHKSCYSSFTSEEKLKRLRKLFDTEGRVQTASCSTSSVQDTTIQTTSRRARSHPVEWKFCIFCQSGDSKGLHNVSTFETSETILSLAKNDTVMRIRLADVNDLIASEGKYHLKCLSSFKRQMQKVRERVDDSDEVLMELCYNIECGLSSGHVYDMGDIWNNYTSKKSERGIAIPQKYLSRKQTFFDNVKKTIGGKCEFVRPLDQRASLLVYPGTESKYVISKTLTKASKGFEISTESDTDSSLSEGEPLDLQPCETGILPELVHTALKIRSDLMDTPGHTNLWKGLDQEHVENIIPDSLYLFLQILFGGLSALDNETGESSNDMKVKVCSIAQDIIYGVSNGTKLTPKHIGLGLSVHQATRSESLVNMLNAANHSVGISTVRRFDNTIAKDILQKYIENGYKYIPENIKKDGFIHCSCDNIDVLESNLDGKNTFHSTQMIIWQRKSNDNEEETDVFIQNLSRQSLDLETLHKMHDLDKAKLPTSGRPSPVFYNTAFDIENWFDHQPERSKSQLQNFGWLISRIQDAQSQTVPIWRAYNETCSPVNPPLTTAGMMPILQAPADEYDTVATVINRFIDVSKHFGQRYTVITADQALYCKGKELVWANPVEYKDVIFRMGGLHVCFNFLKAIGQHVEAAGLEDIWVESGLYAPNTTESMLDGKAYYRAVRGHTLTYEALWRIRWSIFRSWVLRTNAMSFDDIEAASDLALGCFETKVRGYCDNVKECSEMLQQAIVESHVFDHLKNFDDICSKNKNYLFWKTYMDMVEILLDFIKAEREGNWNLHLESFAAILPWLTTYDHVNYARWGPVYLTEMRGLSEIAPEVYKEFMDGNFVVKRSNHRFCQVPPDQATEWINKLCKTSNGIIGITSNDQARDKFCVTWATRSEIAQKTKVMFDMFDEDEETITTRSDVLPSRLALDEMHVEKLISHFDSLDVFCRSGKNIEDIGDDFPDETPICESHMLVSLATKDVVSVDVLQDLETAQQRGKDAVKENIKTRLEDGTVAFFDPIKKFRSKTFSHMYEVTTLSTKQNISKVVKADRKLMQRLFNAANAGRLVHLGDVLKHELSPVPLSLAKVGGVMNSTVKSDILSIFRTDYEIETPQIIPISDIQTCVLIDGHALIQSIRKPADCRTFGDYANVFIRAVFKLFDHNTTRIDLVFDRYIGGKSIKLSTRQKRSRKRRPVRKLIQNRDVPLPQVWDQFISLDENKADLARFLTEEILTVSKDLPDNQELVTSGGFSDICMVKSNRRIFDTPGIDHEEADTRLISHASEALANGYERFLVYCIDTDVLLLLIYHFGSLESEIWMISGTTKSRKCYPVHKISEQLPEPVRLNILGFHSLTGCDTTSSFTGFGKKTCWKVYIKYPDLLDGVGRDGDVASMEKFVCLLYGIPNESSSNLNDARTLLFTKAKKEMNLLPPTKDAFELHVARANYQAKVWMRANEGIMDVESPYDTIGWSCSQDSDELHVVWKRLPAVPVACLELITCSCKTKCRTARCKCFIKGLKCTPSCACDAHGCCNPGTTLTPDPE